MNADIPVDRALAAATILRHPAPYPSPAEQAVIDRIEAAPEPPEITVEKVAAALCDAASDHPDRPVWPDVGSILRDHYRRLATAAITAMPAHPAEAAVKRVEALAERLGDESREFYYDNRHTHENGISYVGGVSDAMEQIADRILAALAPPDTRSANVNR